MAGTCECRNKPSGSIKCRELSRRDKDLLASKEEFCSMELVSYLVS